MQASVADSFNAVSHTTVDSVHAAGTHSAESENVFTQLLHHLYDSREVEIPFTHITLPQFPPIELFGFHLDLSPTKHVVFLWIAAFILTVVARAATRKNLKSPVPKGIGNLIEVFVVFIRDEIAIPTMGRDGISYMPYLLTTFFFILIMNLLGLVPYGATATGNVSVTGGLAIIAFIMIQAAAIKKQGLVRYLAHLTGGVHWALWPIMIPIEILGLFTKAFALCIRLYANMTGGHIVIVSLIGLIFLFGSIWIAPIPVVFAVGIKLLEIFVAFLQAYIFTMLTSLFMGLGMQAEHHEGNHAQ